MAPYDPMTPYNEMLRNNLTYNLRLLDAQGISLFEALRCKKNPILNGGKKFPAHIILIYKYNNIVLNTY